MLQSDLLHIFILQQIPLDNNLHFFLLLTYISLYFYLIFLLPYTIYLYLTPNFSIHLWAPTQIHLNTSQTRL